MLNTTVNDHPNTKEWSLQEREDFLTANKKLIYSCINPYKFRSQRSMLGVDDEDLFQEASIAMWSAFDKYDPNTEASFATYACTAMMNAIREVLRKQGAHKRKIDATAVSYDAIYQNQDDGDYVTGDNMSVINLGPVEESIEDICIRKEMMDIIYDIMNTVFDDREKEIFLSLSMRKKTQTELAEELGYSQSSISLAYKTAKIKLCKGIIDNGYSVEDFLA